MRAIIIINRNQECIIKNEGKEGTTPMHSIKTLDLPTRYTRIIKNKLNLYNKLLYKFKQVGLDASLWFAYVWMWCKHHS